MLTLSGIRVLGPSDLPEFLSLVARDPVVNVFAEHRARTTSLDPRWLGGEVWGRYDDDRLVAACHVGANLVPIECGPDDARAFAEHARVKPRRTMTIVGPERAVEMIWDRLDVEWAGEREIRWRQPHLVLDRASLAEPDPAVRRTELRDIDLVYPACVAMYTEEVGVSPEAGGGKDLYRARVSQLISRGWSFARFEHGRVVFKAEVACASPAAAQIQGVWVAPDRRGQGLAAAGMAAVVDLVRRDIAPVVSLYVNEWNEPARAAYTRVGFRETARFATVMF